MKVELTLRSVASRESLLNNRMFFCGISIDSGGEYLVFEKKSELARPELSLTNCTFLQYLKALLCKAFRYIVQVM